MIKIIPFEGIRYNFKNISRLICPPYDIITKERKDKLLALDRNNFVSVELPSPSYSFYGKEKLYRRARNKFLAMLKKNILTRDEKSFYLYEQKFCYGGKNYLRTGLIAGVKLENPSGKSTNRNIFPHEKILKKPAAERKHLLRILKAQTSAVFFLSNSTKLSHLLKIARANSQLLSIGRFDGITHILRRIDANSQSADALVKFFSRKDSQLFIADGHHRYNVAWQYLCETARRKSPNRKNRVEAPENYVLGYIATGFDTNILVLPTHRILTPPYELQERITRYFTEITASEYKKYLISLRYQNGLLPQPIILRFNKKNIYLKPRISNGETHPKHKKGNLYLKNLAPSIAARTILKGIPPQQISYTHSAEEAQMRADQENKLALIFPPPWIKSIFEISRAGSVMPQKSTYFYPKVYAGIVVYPLIKR